MADNVIPFSGASGSEGATGGPQAPEKFSFPEHIRVALEMIMARLWDAEALIATAVPAVQRELDCDIEGNAMIDRTLKVARQTLTDIGWNLDPDWLERDADTDPKVREEIERRRVARERANRD